MLINFKRANDKGTLAVNPLLVESVAISADHPEPAVWLTMASGKQYRLDERPEDVLAQIRRGLEPEHVALPGAGFSPRA